MTIVHTILSTDERRKVDFFRHDDGTYGVRQPEAERRSV